LTVITGLVDAHCFVKVTDTGCGLPEEHLSRIFEPHFTTKPPGEGTGLGLAIAYRIVEDHGGHFVVESSVGKGTTFNVMIPVQPGGTVP
ncbi:MAG: hybrid sensor histidine kinase/response regulator, partial [Myxococcaceae bacterium]|nr:hybrid sensor histidine kinase/response regulator [Myxococcaceae bacterium]